MRPHYFAIPPLGSMSLTCALFAVASASACGGGSSTSGPVPVASVIVTPNTATLLVGQTQQLTATTRDAAGNILTGRTVTWGSSDATKAAVSGSGLVTAAGTGTPVITATSEGKLGNAAITVTATALVSKFAGDNQTVLVGYPANIDPAVRLTDASSNPVAGVNVRFNVASGGGSVTAATATSDANGVAKVGGWTVGAAPGPNTLTATATGVGAGGAAVTFSANGVTSAFNITIQNVGPPFSAVVQAAFDAAVAYWQLALIGDIPDVTGLTVPAGSCHPGAPALNNVNVDDVLIQASFDSIDGPGAILGGAGPCLVRTSAGAPLTLLGAMIFDSADVDLLVTFDLLNDVIRHEMGHVLGFGTLWSQPPLSCLQNPSPAGVPLDTYFNCPKGLAAFIAIGGTSYTGGNKVPVENCGPASPAGCGSGTVNGHWREPVFVNELMTGYVDLGGNPVSLLTIAAMEDLGYTVNYGAAEPYTQAFFSRQFLRTSASRISLGDDILHLPIRGVDRAGRIVPLTRR